MKSLNKIVLAGAVSLAALCIGQAAPAAVGQAAPDFTLTDISGQQHSLSSFKGKTVVLEWVNPECPFVVKHYDKSGNKLFSRSRPGELADADEAIELLLPVQLIAQAVGFQAVNDRANKDPVHTLDIAQVGVITLAAQGFLQTLGTRPAGGPGSSGRASAP